MKAVEAARAAVEEQLAAARLLPNAFLRSVFESEDAQNWQKRKLGDVCDVVTGGTPPRSEARFYGGSIAWIKPDDLDKSIYVEKSAEYLTEEGGKISRLLPEGSVLVSCIGNIGKLAIAAKTLATNQQINSLIPSEKVDSLYLFYTCKFMKPVFNSEASISLVSILNKSGFSNIEIPLPTKSEQRKIAERLNEQMQAVETLKQSLTEKLEAVKKFPAALLRKAFAGEI
jgi:type I restriction enzyme, S subunit